MNSIKFNTQLRPAGHFIITPHDSDKKIEIGCRICVHCGQQFASRTGIWTPNSQQRKPVRRGFCMRCNGPTCGMDRCIVCIPKEKRLDMAEKGADLATIHLTADRMPVSVGSLWLPSFSKGD